MFEQVKALICQYVDVDPATITEETNIRSDLGLNSLELINIAVAIEDEFDLEIPDREVANIETLGDAVKVIEKYIEDWFKFKKVPVFSGTLIFLIDLSLFKLYT